MDAIEETQGLILMQKWGNHPVHLEVTVGDLYVVVGALHLAQRHPQYPENSRRMIVEYIERFLASMYDLEPALGHFLRKGLLDEEAMR